MHVCWAPKFSAFSSKGPFKIFLGSSLVYQLKVIINHIILSYMYFNLGLTAKRHFKLYGDSISLLPLKLDYSRRASHQISTHILHVLLEEVLGYEDVVLVPDDSGFSVSDGLLKLTGCKNHRYVKVAQNSFQPLDF